MSRALPIWQQRRPATAIATSKRGRGATIRPPREAPGLQKAARVIDRRALALPLGLLAVLAATPARAQDAGTGVGALAPSDFFIGVQHQQGSNLSDFDVARFFNKANCDCDEPVFLFFTLLNTGFAKKAAVIGMPGNVEFWVGTNCSTVITRNAQ